MAELLLQTEACLILRTEGGENTRPLTLLSGKEGILHAHQRKTKTRQTAQADLFDELWLGLASDNQGRSWFVRELRVLRSRKGIGRSYETLTSASRMATVASLNPAQSGAAQLISTLLGRSLDALDAGSPADIVYLKFLYCFARDEGYAVRQHWLESLPHPTQGHALLLLSTPLASVTPEMLQEIPAQALIDRLEDFIREHTDLALPKG